ncbi:hypothetical protein HPCPY6271_0483 [Helicobacter pylori CPY6271]|nr:hypothetical protein HPCPY6271_0483 [Helicobacter pylori CPY6271]
MLDFLNVKIRISPIAINKHNKLPMGDLFNYDNHYKTKSTPPYHQRAALFYSYLILTKKHYCF